MTPIELPRPAEWTKHEFEVRDGRGRYYPTPPVPCVVWRFSEEAPGDGTITPVAVIELSDGQIQVVYAQHVRFTDREEGY